MGNLVLRGMSLISVALHNGNGRISDMGCDLSRPYTNARKNAMNNIASSPPRRSDSLRVIVSPHNHRVFGTGFTSSFRPSVVRSLSSVL